MNTKPFRLRINSGNGKITGTVASGSISTGSQIKILPEATVSTVAEITQDGASCQTANPGDTIDITLDPPLAFQAGSIICNRDDPVEIADQFEVEISWNDDEPMLAGRPYSFRFGPQSVIGTITNLKRRLSKKIADGAAATTLHTSEKGIATISLKDQIAFVPFNEDQTLGSFQIDDRADGDCLATGQIIFALRRASNIHRQAIDLDRNAHAVQKKQRACVLWLTGLSGSGKSAVGNEVEKLLYAMGKHTCLLDGDNVRHGLNRDLGFTDVDRVENIRRISEVAKLMTDAGLIVITSFISPFISERMMARERMMEGEFFEVFIDTPLDVCEQRDEKGLYAKARAGLIKNFTGIDSDYEPPENPEITIKTTAMQPQEAAEKIISVLQQQGRLS